MCAWIYANGVRGQITTTVGALADAEGLRPVPAPCSAAGSVAHGEQSGTDFLPRQQLFGAARSQLLAATGAPPPGELTVEMVTDTGVVLARHHRVTMRRRDHPRRRACGHTGEGGAGQLRRPAPVSA